MASQKFQSLLILLTVSTALVNGQEPESRIPKDVIVGYRQPNDHLLERQIIKRSNLIQSHIEYEKTFVGDNHSIITQIRIIDLNTKNNGANVKILAGGPKDSFVTIAFKSLSFSGIDFSVEIYGKEPTEKTRTFS